MLELFFLVKSYLTSVSTNHVTVQVVQAGLPPGVVDLWEACGQRPECRYTWDITRNTNKEVGSFMCGLVVFLSLWNGTAVLFWNCMSERTASALLLSQTYKQSISLLQLSLIWTFCICGLGFIRLIKEKSVLYSHFTLEIQPFLIRR